MKRGMEKMRTMKTRKLKKRKVKKKKTGTELIEKRRQMKKRR